MQRNRIGINWCWKWLTTRRSRICLNISDENPRGLESMFLFGLAALETLILHIAHPQPLLSDLFVMVCHDSPSEEESSELKVASEKASESCHCEFVLANTTQANAFADWKPNPPNTKAQLFLRWKLKDYGVKQRLCDKAGGKLSCFVQYGVSTSVLCAMVTNKDIEKKHMLNDKHHTANDGKCAFQNQNAKHQLIGQTVSHSKAKHMICCACRMCVDIERHWSINTRHHMFPRVLYFWPASKSMRRDFSGCAKIHLSKSK